MGVLDDGGAPASCIRCVRHAPIRCAAATSNEEVLGRRTSKQHACAYHAASRGTKQGIEHPRLCRSNARLSLYCSCRCVDCTTALGTGLSSVFVFVSSICLMSAVSRPYSLHQRCGAHTRMSHARLASWRAYDIDKEDFTFEDTLSSSNAAGAYLECSTW